MNSFFLPELLSFFFGDSSILLSVFLVANKEHDDVWFALCHDFLVPVVQIQKGLLSRDVIGEEDAVSTSVEDFGD